MRGRTLIYAVALFGLLAMLASATWLARELVLLGASQASIIDASIALAFGPRAAWLWLGLAGAVVWGLAWLVIGRRSRPDERALVARKAYLSIGQGVALAAAIIQAYRLIFGLLTPIKPDAWLVEALGRLSGIAIALAFWAFLRVTAAQDGDFGDEMGAGAGWRRVVYYGLAAAALAALLIGLAGLLQIILDAVLAIGPVDVTTAAQSQLRFAQMAALALVGAPAWWGCWWSQQALARAPGEIGGRERRSRTRRAYLYGILLVTAVAFFFSLGMSILGMITGRGPANAVTWAPIAIVALGCLGGHFGVLRGDERAQADDRRRMTDDRVVTEPVEPRRYVRAALPAATAASNAPAILVIDGGDGTLGARLLIALAEALPSVRLWSLGVNAAAEAAMSNALGGASPATPPDAPARATLIIGPSDMIMPGGLGGAVSAELAAAVAASPARKLLLPSRNPALRWIAAPDWPDERWIENAVIEATNWLG